MSGAAGLTLVVSPHLHDAVRSIGRLLAAQILWILSGGLRA